MGIHCTHRKIGRPLPLKRIAVIGRQVREGLEFLKERKYMYRNLHSGNVICHNGVYRLAGLEGIYFGHEHCADKQIQKAITKIGKLSIP